MALALPLVCSAGGAGSGRWGPPHAPSGLTSTSRWVESLAVDPTKPTTIYAGFLDVGVFKSTNGGRTWRDANRGIKLNPNPTTLYDVNVVVLAPSAPMIAYAGGNGAGSFGVYRSTNGGRRWQTQGRRVIGGGVYAIAVHPRRPGTVYVGSSQGVAKTTNSGRSWFRANVGLPRDDPSKDLFFWVTALAIAPSRPETVYLGDNGGRVFKSTDGARSWEMVGGDPHEFGSVVALAVDPRRPEVVYRAINHGVPTTTNGGIAKSTDGGNTWRLINRGLPSPNGTPSAYAVAIDPRAPETIYIAANGGDLFTTDGGIFKSTDGGETWSLFVEGLRKPDREGVECVLVDATGRTLYLGGHNGVFDYRYASAR
jgi:photosystem II stability/assembly factor-like uncharacterized protein